jgi:hypothetical protein
MTSTPGPDGPPCRTGAECVAGLPDALVGGMVAPADYGNGDRKVRDGSTVRNPARQIDTSREEP